jgi:hypothetical protein
MLKKATKQVITTTGANIGNNNKKQLAEKRPLKVPTYITTSLLPQPLLLILPQTVV